MALNLALTIKLIVFGLGLGLCFDHKAHVFGLGFVLGFDHKAYVFGLGLGNKGQTYVLFISIQISFVLILIFR